MTGLYGAAVAGRVASAAWGGELDAATHQARGDNPVCGDEAEIRLRVVGGRIEDARWMARGCPPTLAALDVLCEMVSGHAIGEARAVTADALAEALPGLPPTSRHACALAVLVLDRALADA